MHSNKNLVALMLDKLTHSMSDRNNPNHLEYDYVKFFAVIYNYLNQENPPVLFLGGGGYTLPRYLVDKYKTPKATVVEIDPEVTKIAHEQLFMPKDSSVITVSLDARMYLRNLAEDQKYRIVFGDAFSDYSIPYHLTTKEFTRMIADRLENDGTMPPISSTV